MSSKGNIKIILEAVDRASKVFREVGNEVKTLGEQVKQTSSLTKSFGDIIKIAAGVSLPRLISATKDFLGEAASLNTQFQTLKASFNKLVEASGATTLSLESLREATENTISDVELLKASNTALSLGLPTDKLNELFKAAMKLGAAVGQDARKSVEDLTVALGRQSPKILDNLGVTFKAADAYEWYAKQIGKTSDALSENEKRLAWQSYAIKQVTEKAAVLGDNISDAQKAQEKMKAAVDNLKTSIGKYLTPALETLADRINNRVIPAFDDFFDRIDKVTGALGPFMDKIGPLLSLGAKTQKVFRPWEYSADEVAKALVGLGQSSKKVTDHVEKHEETLENAAETTDDWRKRMVEAFNAISEMLAKQRREFADFVGSLSEKFNVLRAESAENLDEITRRFDAAFEAGKFREAAEIVKSFADEYRISWEEAERIITEWKETQQRALEEALSDLEKAKEKELDVIEEAYEEQKRAVETAYDDRLEALRDSVAQALGIQTKYEDETMRLIERTMDERLRTVSNAYDEEIAKVNEFYDNLLATQRAKLKAIRDDREKDLQDLELAYIEQKKVIEQQLEEAIKANEEYHRKTGAWDTYKMRRVEKLEEALKKLEDEYRDKRSKISDKYREQELRELIAQRGKEEEIEAERQAKIEEIEQQKAEALQKVRENMFAIEEEYVAKMQELMKQRNDELLQLEEKLWSQIAAIDEKYLQKIAGVRAKYGFGYAVTGLKPGEVVAGLAKEKATTIHISGPLVVVEGSADKRTAELAADLVEKKLKTVLIESTSPSAPTKRIRITRRR